eukprot:TRINITY_DN2269_c1_g1_i1.p1 TRINITY_DN2269_c1_g1~~TRINITY_DN2269_c1_g1_i1.p1  ORF type:complete len:333 (-),score=188.62 TRINITY_DN2269_c1_g1_i1:118-1047(-)
MSSSQEFLRSLIVKDFPNVARNGGSIFRFASTDKLHFAMKKLVELDIHSAPVWNEEEKQYVGMLDVVDIVEFLTTVFDEAEVIGEDFLSLMEQIERFATTEVQTCADLSHRNPFVPISDDADLYSVVRILSEYGVHRVNVFDEQGQLTNIITQSALLKLIDTNLEKLSEVVNKSVGELDIGTSPVITIPSTHHTIGAFKLIREKKLYAVPVIDANGSLIGNISARDVRFVVKSPAHMYLLYEPISKFISQIHADEIEERSPAICCRASDSLKSIVKKLLVNRINRIYITDHDGKPTKVITLTDVLLALM